MKDPKNLRPEGFWRELGGAVEVEVSSRPRQENHERFAGQHEERVDVTIRSPFALQAQRVTPAPGTAAIMGEADKHRRYRPDVIPFSVEAFGRFAPKAAHFF